MDESADWIEKRLTAALEAAGTDHHKFPDAVATELRKLLEGPLQEPRRKLELEQFATALAAANRGTT